uniref:Mobile element protein n=1 Tax=Nonomuraea gerenzanensis TaxID=93944 RepID=A0A1M4EDD7_9ACTN|nr:Mobile element protein [Nonomuraea gerenzanensis]
MIIIHHPVHERSQRRRDQDNPSPGRGATPARHPVHRPVRRNDRSTAGGMSAAPKISALRGGHITLAAAADAFLATPPTANPNTHRAYASAIDRVTALSAETVRSPASPTPRSAPRSPSCGARARLRPGTATVPPSPPGSPGATPGSTGPPHRSRPTPNAARRAPTRPARSPRPPSTGCCPAATSRSARLCRMLYETAARAAEILAPNVEDLDLEHRRAPVRSKGGSTEWVYWDSGTAHLLPRLIRLPDGSTRTHGRCSCPNAAPSPPAARPPPTSARTPATPAWLRPRPRPAGEIRRARPAPAASQCRRPPRRGRSPAAARHGQDPAHEPPHRHALRQTRRRGDRQGHRGPGTPSPYSLIHQVPVRQADMAMS